LDTCICEHAAGMSSDSRYINSQSARYVLSLA
jgi:hypothetical protein